MCKKPLRCPQNHPAEARISCSHKCQSAPPRSSPSVPISAEPHERSPRHVTAPTCDINISEICSVPLINLNVITHEC